MKTVRPGVMLDCSRGAVYAVPAVKKFIDVLAKMGYGSLQLYTEEVYTVEGEPYFGYMRGRYSPEELKELDAYAAGQGIELIPCIQTLAHLGGLTRWPQAYGDITDTADILLAGEERTYALIEKMFASCAANFKSRRINIGMDEAHFVGLGKYLDKHGYENRFEILAKHLTRVAEIAKKYGFRPMMWSDMFFRLANHGNYYVEEGKEVPIEEVAKLVPENVDLIYWDYYSRDGAHYDRMIRAHKKFKNGLVFAGGAWCWTGFAPCNGFSIEANRAAVASCIEHGVDNIFITVWKDDGSESSLFSVLPALFASAEFCRGNFDDALIHARFKEVCGMEWDEFLRIGLPNLPAGKNEITNPCKYMLYSDPFYGIFDYTVFEGGRLMYAQAKAALEESAGNAEYGYIFRTLADLCGVMELKYDLGVRTRALYREKNMDGLCLLLNDYRECERRLNAFYESFRAQWMREAKGFGFERHDIRIGGLMQRLKNCSRLLEDYLRGEIDCIEELEQDIIADGEKGKTICFNNWLRTATICNS